MGNCISGNANGNVNAAASSASSGGGRSGSSPAATLKSPHNTAGLSSPGAAKPASSSNGALELRGDPLAAAPTRNSVIRAPALSQGELRKLKAKRLAVAAEALAEGTQIAKVEKSPAQFQLIAKAVSGNPLFTSLQNEARTVIIMSMFPQEVGPGREIIQQGDAEAETFYVLESGSADVFINGEKVHTYGPGTCFGELALLYNSPRVATVQATAPCKMWVMERKAYSVVRTKMAKQLDKDRHEAIDGCQIFAALSDDRKQAVTDALEPVTFETGEYVFHKGDVGDRFYIIQSGEVSVVDDGKELTRLGQGQWFGERALMGDDTRAASAFAKSDGVRLFYLNRQAFQDLIGPIQDVWRWESLRSLPLLASVSNDQINELLNMLESAEVGRDKYIFQAGEEGDALYVVESGELVVVDPDNNVTLATLKKGSCFGELALLKNDVRSASVVTISDVKLLRITRASFETALGGTLEALTHAWKVQLLQSVSILQNVNAQKLDEVASLLDSKSYGAGTNIVTKGEAGDTFYIVQSGILSVLGDDGSEEATLTSGQFFGELALLNNDVRRKTVQAKMAAQLLCLPRSAFERVVGSLQAMLDEHAKLYGGGTGPGKLAISSPKDLKTLAVLGIGAFGKVLLCKSGAPGAPPVMALKILKKAQILQTGLQKHVMRERDVMMQCDTPFMVNLLQTFKDKEHLYMLLEAVMGGELFTYLSGKNGVPEKQSRFYTACVVLAFEYLNTRNYIYRDLKPENLLIDTDGYVKVADFGFAKKLDRGKTYTMCGTPDYLAPELVQQSGHGKAVDWWALGVLIFEMTAGFPPFAGSDQIEQMSAILAVRYTVPQQFSKEVRDIVKKLLVANAAKRLGTLKGGPSDVKKHPWFKDLDWEALKSKGLRAPYVPKLKSIEDTSCFDDYDINEEHPGESFKPGRKLSNGVFDSF